MQYELARKLKAAGFWKADQALERRKTDTIDGELLYYPDLEELIAECWNVGTFDLLRYCGEGEYEASGMRGREDVCGVGETPSDAVANLWLALHPVTSKE